MNTPYLSVRDLHLAYGDLSVLAGLSFHIAAGEVYCLLGPNGAGKSTTISIVCDLLRPQQGSVTIGGMSHTEVPRERLGIAPQEIAIYRDLTCIQNLEFFGTVYGLRGPTRRKRAEDCLDVVGLRERADSLVAELSGGMRRRLQLATALIHDPPLLILDEPTVGLDLEIRERVWDVINGLRREGRTILLTTHHLEEAERLGTRIGIIDSGQIVVEGSMEALRRHVAAAVLAVVESEDPDAVCHRARQLGIAFRRRADATVLWLPEEVPIRSVVHTLGDVPLTSVRLKSVGLEEIFPEVLGGANGFADPHPGPQTI